MAFQRRNDAPADQRREDATKFMQELTGIPARSIGSQISPMPAVPQPSSPLASVGQPPTENSLEAIPAAAAVSTIDVFAGMEDPGDPPITAFDESPPDTNETAIEQVELTLEDSVATEAETAPEPLPDSSIDTEPASEPAIEQLPETETAPEAEIPPVPVAEMQPMVAPDVSHSDRSPDFVTPDPVEPQQLDSPDEPIVSAEPPTADIPSTPQSNQGDDLPFWARYSAPVDVEVIQAGGNPMMARRSDLTHEQKMEIAERNTSERQQLREERQERYDQRQPERDSPPSNATSDSTETIQAPLLFSDPPASDSAPTEPTQQSEPDNDPPEQAPQSSQTDEVAADSDTASPPNIAANVPLTAENFELIRQMVMEATGRPQSGQRTIPVSPQPSTLNPQVANASPVAFDPEPTSQIDTSQDAQYTEPLAMANDFIDRHNEVIRMIIDALSRLTAGYTVHRARLSTILDRLDSESQSNEYGEGDSTWMG